MTAVPGQRSRVVIVGAGVAALEGLVGLAKLAGDRVELTLVAPEAAFTYRPASTARPFSLGPQRELALGDIAGDQEARLVRDTVAFVDEERNRVLTHAGDVIPFDALLLAFGTRWTWPLEEGIHWGRGEEAASEFALLVAEAERGAAGRVGVIVPPGACWPVDAYELALILAAAAKPEGDVEILLVTAERRPLESLGPAVSDAVAEELDRAGVTLVMAASPDESAFDRVLSVPAASRVGVSGVPRGPGGLIRVGADSRVRGSERIWAAGDCTALAVKHALLAVRQADAAVAGIAATAGASVAPDARAPRLHGVVVLPGRSLSASVWIRSGEPLTHCLWWPPGRAAGGHLGPYLAARDPAVRHGLVWHPHGLPVDVPVAELDGGSATEAVAHRSSDERAFERDALDRELMAVARLERESAQRERKLERGLLELERRQRAVVEQLEAAGYLHHDVTPA